MDIVQFYVNLAFLLSAEYNDIKRERGFEMILSAVYSEGQAHKHRHYHDCYQILYIVKGSAQVEVSGQIHQAAAGSLLIFSRLEQHSITARSSDYCRYVLEISPKISAETQLSPRVLSVLVNRPEGFCNLIRMEQIGSELEPIFRQIVAEKEAPGFLSSDLQSLLLQDTRVFRHNISNMLYGLQGTTQSDC